MPTEPIAACVLERIFSELIGLVVIGGWAFEKWRRHGPRR
jgi:hypothetical protein